MTTKEAVLGILTKENTYEKDNYYVSGETLGKALGISRAAVNSAIRALRDDGYEIFSTTKNGYFLLNSPDTITKGELFAYLPPERLETVLCLESADSTNNRLREIAYSGAPAGQTVIAETQTAGRGRYGRQFVSPKSKGVYISYLLRPENVKPENVANLTAWVAVAVLNAVEKVCGIRPDVKWVNDLLINGKKICGILTETSIESETGHIQNIVIGAGVNVNETAEDFPEELREKATSLFIETGRKISRALLAAELIKEFDILQKAFPAEKERYLAAYKNACITVGKTVKVSIGKEEKIGFATAVSDDFALNVRFENGEEKIVASGEASVRGENGYI